MQVVGGRWQLHEHDFKAGLTSMFHGRNHIGVTAHQQNPFYRPLVGESGYVQSHPHIHTFLFEDRNKISV